MRVLVTGATGFVGRHVIPALLALGHEVVALARREPDPEEVAWLDQVRFVAHDFHQETAPPFRDFAADALLHLAWSGLPDYRSAIHLRENYPASLRLVEQAVAAGIRHIAVTGTCLEYGMQQGCLHEELPCHPGLPYAKAKDRLRQALFEMAEMREMTVQWIRLFYMFGPGQNPRSLLAALERSVSAGEQVFNMSGGEQVRDYLPIEQVAYYICRILEHPEFSGVLNCCSGQPVKVRELVERYLHEQGQTIRLNLGYYDYPDYEPMAFWGDNSRLMSLIGSAGDRHEPSHQTR